jgi:predicted dehydrogenase
MPESKIRLGMIGSGRIAQAHLAAIKNLKDEVNLIAVADVDEKKAEEAKERLGAKFFTRRQEDVLQDKDIEAVIVTLPNHLHHPVVLQAAKVKRW